MKLSKYSGAGNTFILVENEKEESPTKIQELCKKYECDGFINILNKKIMRYFNADGFEAKMCGNGLRCVIQYLWEQGDKKELYSIETRAGIKQGRIEGHEVLCFLGAPSQIKWNQEIEVEGKRLSFHFLNTSVEHAVFFLNPVDVHALGAKIRYHDYFAPLGTNVNFITKIEKNALFLRTYERGVERETLACGTGAIASALTAAKIYGHSSPITVHVQSGDKLHVGFSYENDLFRDLTLKGSAKRIF